MKNLVRNDLWMIFSKCPADKADDILDALWTAIGEFVEGGPQGDDMTALALCRERGVSGHERTTA